MKLHFYGGARIVSGANYLLETKDKKLLIDCGLFHGPPELENKNREDFPYNPAEVDFVLITHAHLDHIGRLPKLVKDGFKGKILATPPTIDFARLALEDSQRLLEEKAVKAGVIPLFDHLEIEQIMSYFQPVEYDKKIELTKDIVCFFREAGHILGSGIIEIWVRQKPRQAEYLKIVFTGDLGGRPTFLLKEPAYVKQADYVIMESAYGDRDHPQARASKDLLEDAIEETVARGGVLMIPSFALERTQKILYQLNELAEHRRIPYVPIYIDSPLAIKMTEMYRKHKRFFKKEVVDLIEAGEAIFKFPGLSYTSSTQESKMINRVPPPKIIMAGSGMSQGGRILHHEMRYLPDPKSTLLIVTYQAAGTLGRQLLEGAQEVRIKNEVIPVRAQIRNIAVYSAHADQSGLLDWLKHIQKPIKKVFLVQGDEESVLVLRQVIRDSLGLDAQAPGLNESFEL